MAKITTSFSKTETAYGDRYKPQCNKAQELCTFADKKEITEDLINVLKTIGFDVMVIDERQREPIPFPKRMIH